MMEQEEFDERVRVICPNCRGEGGNEEHRCHVCRGTGKVWDDD